MSEKLKLLTGNETYKSILDTRFTDIDYISIFTEVSQFDSYKKIEVFCKENGSKSI